MERVRDHALRAERVITTPPRAATLPSHGRTLAALAEAEQAEGWLARCIETGQFLTLNVAFVDSLAQALRRLDARPWRGRDAFASRITASLPDDLAPRAGISVLEVCAGDGSLAAALRDRGVTVKATDSDPPADGTLPVARFNADEALRRHRPRVVLGSFVPVDSDVDRQVLDDPGVRHYVVLNARIGGEYGAACLWRHAGWTRTRLAAVDRWMICRHDVWLGAHRPPLRHGEAWLLSRDHRPR